MEIVFVRMSSKGQIVVPKALRGKLGFLKGKRLVMAVSGKRLVVEEAGHLEKLLEDDFSDLLEASESSMGFWNNEKDKVWDNV